MVVVYTKKTTLKLGEPSCGKDPAFNPWRYAMGNP